MQNNCADMTLSELRHHINRRQRALLRQIADREIKIAECHDIVPADERGRWARERRIAVLRAEQDVLRRELHEVADGYATAWWGRSKVAS